MAALSSLIRLNALRSTALKIIRSVSTVHNASTNIPTVSLTNVARNCCLYQNSDLMKGPISSINSLNLPSGMIWLPYIEEPSSYSSKIIEEPLNADVDGAKQAARLIIIRRKKMRKHKLRKLRKKMKFEWAKIRQKRELRKEKEFQAVLIKQYKEAESFSAENYVNEKLARLNEVTSQLLADKNRRM